MQSALRLDSWVYRTPPHPSRSIQYDALDCLGVRRMQCVWNTHPTNHVIRDEESMNVLGVCMRWMQLDFPFSPSCDVHRILPGSVITVANGLDLAKSSLERFSSIKSAVSDEPLKLTIMPPSAPPLPTWSTNFGENGVVSMEGVGRDKVKTIRISIFAREPDSVSVERVLEESKRDAVERLL